MSSVDNAAVGGLPPTASFSETRQHASAPKEPRHSSSPATTPPAGNQHAANAVSPKTPFVSIRNPATSRATTIQKRTTLPPLSSLLSSTQYKTRAPREANKAPQKTGSSVPNLHSLDHSTNYIDNSPAGAKSLHSFVPESSLPLDNSSAVQQQQRNAHFLHQYGSASLHPSQQQQRRTNPDGVSFQETGQSPFASHLAGTVSPIHTSASQGLPPSQRDAHSMQGNYVHYPTNQVKYFPSQQAPMTPYGPGAAVPHAQPNSTYTAQHAHSYSPPSSFSYPVQYGRRTKKLNSGSPNSGKRKRKASTGKFKRFISSNPKESKKRKIDLTKEDISMCFGLTQNQAAETLGISLSTLKKYFYLLYPKGFRWPGASYCDPNNLEKQKEQLEKSNTAEEATPTETKSSTGESGPPQHKEPSLLPLKVEDSRLNGAQSTGSQSSDANISIPHKPAHQMEEHTTDTMAQTRATG